MPRIGIPRAILGKPAQLERKFLWLRAAEAYRESLSLVARGERLETEILERMGYAYFCSAIQSNDAGQFRRRLREAIATYRKAIVRFERSRGAEHGPHLRCWAMKAYLEYWATTKHRLKRRLLDQSWSLAKRALRSFEEVGDYLEFARTYNQLSIAVAISYQYDWNAHRRRQKLREAIEYGRKAIRTLPRLGDTKQLVRAYVRTALFLDTTLDHGFEIEKQGELDREALEYWTRAVRLDRSTAVLEIAHPPTGFWRILDNEESLRICGEALNLARDSRDNFATAWLLDQLAARTYWKAKITEDPKERMGIAAKSLRLAEQAAKRYDLLGFTGPNDGVMWAHSPYAEHFLLLSGFVTDTNKRRQLLEKSWREARELLALAERSPYPKIMSYAHHVMSKTALNLARIETNTHRSKMLLQEGLRHRTKCIAISRRIEPSSYQTLGAHLRYLAEAKGDLAELEEDPKARNKLLLEAVRTKEEGISLTVKYVESVSRGQGHTLRPILGRYYYEYGDLLSHLHETSGNEDDLRSAVKAYEEAARWCENASMPVRLAECYWKAGQTYDNLEAHTSASENFHLASKNYETAAHEIPQLKELYQEYALYLRAWHKIEQARVSHRRMEYNEAGKLYQKAADLHNSTTRWRFIVPYYRARAKLEFAESLSKRNLGYQAILAFENASRVFQDSVPSLRNQLPLLDSPDEKAMISVLVNWPIAGYCQARVMIEEAKIADSLGDHRASSEKFGLAAGKLDEISMLLNTERQRKEILFTASLARAWQLMTKAMAENLDGQFRAACNLFVKSKQLAQDENAGILALGHGHFCQAIEASNKFVDTLDPEYYRVATKHLGIATNHYVKSGFTVASENARACQLLLDAHAQIARAGEEVDQQARAAHYGSARTLLHEAAAAFGNAQQASKREQVVTLLERLDKDWELSSHLTEISKAASTVPTTVAYPTFLHGDEAAVGLARFEGPDIEAKLVADRKDSDFVGSFEFAIEIANTGNQTVWLARVEGVIPTGTKIVEAPDICRSVGHSLILNQRRIEPSKLETFRITLQLKEPGVVLTEPRIVFIDQSGQQRQRDLPAKILVTSPILEFLVAEFTDDYRRKSLALDHCGWRTLMDIVHALKIPRSHVYGDSRYGHIRGKQLEALIGPGLVESRIFPGERGRGGEIVKVRVVFGNQAVRECVDRL